MCGIVGYVGRKEAQSILVNSLRRLEYRGYDSCGITLGGRSILTFKDAVRIDALSKNIPIHNSCIGIGHTRWATHGKPSRINAHPHGDCSGKISVVHNGVVDNFLHLREQLIEEGHVFLSETDSEVMPHLVEKYYDGNLKNAVCRALEDIKGSYAFVVIHTDHNELVVARHENPLIIGIGDKENFVASDVPAVLDYTDRVIYLEDGDIGVVTGESIEITCNGKFLERTVHQIPWNLEEAQKTGYEHFMIKEIHEQPKAIRDTYKGYISALEPIVSLGIERDIDFTVLMLACGTSYHAALVGKHIIQELAHIPVQVELASEFNYSQQILDKSRVIVISQSGETADSLKALRKAKEAKCRTMVITNVVGSSATRLADDVLYITAGPEISVAATKSFTAQLIMLYLLALGWAIADTRALSNMIAELRHLPNRVHELLDTEEAFIEYGKLLAGYENIFIVARGINYPVALEGALKIKEISYIHAEGYPAGELKHGPFALLTPSTPVIAIVAQDNTYDTMLANIREIKARESPVLAIAEETDVEIEKYVDYVVRVPKVNALYTPVINTIALQLLAYYTAKERGCPIDMPRNLAKSVTVE